MKVQQKHTKELKNACLAISLETQQSQERRQCVGTRVPCKIPTFPKFTNRGNANDYERSLRFILYVTMGEAREALYLAITRERTSGTP